MTVENGVTIISCDTNGGVALWNEATLTVNGGTFKVTHVGSVNDAGGPGCLYNIGTATINGGKFESNSARTYAIISVGTMEINNATVTTGTHGAVAVDAGTAVINGGSFSATVHYGIYSYNGDVTVNGGKFTGGYADVCIDSGASGTIVLKGGEYTKDVSAYVAPGYKAVENNGIWTVSALFSEGSGTEADPFILSSREDLIAASSVAEYCYFKMADNTVIDGSNWPTNLRLSGNLDGNGAVINDLSFALFRNVGIYDDVENTYTIKNLTINADMVVSGAATALARSCPSNFVVENVAIHGHIEGTSGAAGFIAYGPGNNTSLGSNANLKVTFKNCYSNADIVATGEGGVGFILNPFASTNAENSMITIIDSIFEGHIYVATQLTRAKYFIYTYSEFPLTATYSESFIAEYGAIEGELYAAEKVDEGGFRWVGGWPKGGTYSADTYLGEASLIAVNNNAALPALGSAFTVAKAANAASAIVTFEIAPNGTDETGAFLGAYMTETIALSEVTDTFTTTKIKYFNVTINNEEAPAGVTGDTYNVVGVQYGKTHNGANVRVVQYDADGNIVSITNYKIAAATTPT